MSVFSILLLLLIAYLCFKAIGSIWRDAFGGVGTESPKEKREQQAYDNQSQANDSYSQENKKKQQRPIEKGEGEYVDFEDV